MDDKTMKNLAWNTFKQTGNINSFLEFKQIENMNSLQYIDNMQIVDSMQNINNLQNINENRANNANSDIINGLNNIEEIK